ncbi:endoglucanase [Monoraphidium neglectum]|uniref:Endoglucanase n=1 Tax=Monoraphidium neglectum TaxID=145388 RepID=A0A0D2KEM0_9CHLO|nr:endoglucanase [Monoraphidium neglectum]KIY94278.1 endoglucanase [Monoraphidium neglectum]|eukprot:XP_013893298.1 endoglucanase [Monoraphidium neglectum]
MSKTAIVTVSYGVTGGTATPGADFGAVGGSLTFAPGETSKTVTVPVTGDSAFEPDESIVIGLSNPTGGAALGTPAAATVTITNDDAPRAQINTVMTRLSVVTGGAACGGRWTATPLKPAGWAAGGKTIGACTQSAALKPTLKGVTFIDDVTVAAATRSGSKRASVGCPRGYSKVSKSLVDGAAPFGGATAAVHLCFRTAANAAATEPLVGIRAAASPASCDAADGWRAALFASTTGGRAGQAADLNAGTGAAAPMYLCLQQRTAPAAAAAAGRR